MAQTFWCGITPEMDTAPNTIECWNLRDETPMNVLVGTHPSPKEGLPDRATPDCGKKCTSHSSFSPGLPSLLNDPLHLISCSCWPAPKDWAKSSNSPLSLQVPDVMKALVGSGILYKLKTFRLSGHFPEPDIATTRDTQELKEHRSVDHGGVPYIQRVCCSISKSEAS